MKILIADDSEQKIEDLVAFFHEYHLPIENIDKSYSFRETVQLLMKEKYDLVMLDMSMPTKTNVIGSKSRSLAGRDILSTVRFNGITSTKFVIFSQFGEFGRHDEVISLQEIYQALEEEFGELLLGCLKYDSTSETWKEKLYALMESNL